MDEEVGEGEIRRDGFNFCRHPAMEQACFPELGQVDGGAKRVPDLMKEAQAHGRSTSNVELVAKFVRLTLPTTPDTEAPYSQFYGEGLEYGDCYVALPRNAYLYRKTGMPVNQRNPAERIRRTRQCA